MDLYPAIDLRAGRCVRLLQGDYDRQVSYDSDPVAVAVSFAEAGAPWIHTVDLDAARHGELSQANQSVIADICAAVSVPVQCGGGVRTAQAAHALRTAGVERCVLGTAAIENPDLVTQLTSTGFRVAVGLDVRGDEIATHGWERSTGISLAQALPRFAEAGAEAVIVTQINRDGMGAGADLSGLASVLELTALDVIASGGIGSLAHITELANLQQGEQGERQLAGAICGKALHDGTFEIAAALAAAHSTTGSSTTGSSTTGPSTAGSSNTGTST